MELLLSMSLTLSVFEKNPPYLGHKFCKQDTTVFIKGAIHELPLRMDLPHKP